jgi:flavin reductase (DIM6/NTAB) family NADH-FMN oxidoreductase RutF
MDVTAAATLFAWMDREIWLVTARAGDRRGGLISSSVTQASIVSELPRILIVLAKQHYTWELVEASGIFALHLLSPDNLDLVWRFGLESGRDLDKFDGIEAKSSALGTPVLGGTIGWIDCRVEERMDIGDRTVYVAEVVEGEVAEFGPPLLSGRLMELASPSQLARLQRDRHLDASRDTDAILAWRAAKTTRPPVSLEE